MHRRVCMLVHVHTCALPPGPWPLAPGPWPLAPGPWPLLARGVAVDEAWTRRGRGKTEDVGYEETLHPLQSGAREGVVGSLYPVPSTERGWEGYVGSQHGAAVGVVGTAVRRVQVQVRSR